MKQLQCNLVQNAPIRIGDHFSDNDEWLSGLQKLIGGTVVECDEKTDVVIAKAEDGRQRVCRNATTGRYAVYVPSMEDARRRVVLYRIALMYAFMRRILQGEQLLPMHGCLLKTGEQDGILLCGQSGMGKTTTARRRIEAGGEAIADDMILLEYGAGKFLAHPLPTWSRCIESTEGEWYPFEASLHVQAVLSLSRDEHSETIRTMGNVPYMSAIYASCAFFNLEFGKKMRAEEQQRFIKAVQNGAQHIFEHFPHLGLFANLDGDIRKTLDEYKMQLQPSHRWTRT